MAQKNSPKKAKKASGKKDLQTPHSEGGERKEIRLMYDENDPTYTKIVENAEEEERSPAKEVKVFLKSNYK